jgi:hypothetical protein
MTPWYTDQEIDDMCAGLVNNAAKVRYLRSMGLTVTQKPNGRALVMRGHAELVLSGLKQLQAIESKPKPTQTNRAGLISMFGNKMRAA